MWSSCSIFAARGGHITHILQMKTPEPGSAGEVPEASGGVQPTSLLLGCVTLARALTCSVQLKGQLTAVVTVSPSGDCHEGTRTAQWVQPRAQHKVRGPHVSADVTKGQTQDQTRAQPQSLKLGLALSLSSVTRPLSPFNAPLFPPQVPNLSQPPLSGSLKRARPPRTAPNPLGTE